MRVRSHVVEQHDGQLDAGQVVLEAERDRGRALSRAVDVDHEDDRGPDDPSHLGGAPLHPTAAPVEETHHALDQGQVRAERSLGEHLLQRAFAQHPGIEVAAGPAAHVRQVGRVDVVGTDLEGLDREALRLEGRDQPCRQRRLPDTGGRAGYYQPRGTELVQHLASLSICTCLQGSADPRLPHRES